MIDFTRLARQAAAIGMPDRMGYVEGTVSSVDPVTRIALVRIGGSRSGRPMPVVSQDLCNSLQALIDTGQTPTVLILENVVQDYVRTIGTASRGDPNQLSPTINSQIVNDQLVTSSIGVGTGTDALRAGLDVAQTAYFSGGVTFAPPTPAPPFTVAATAQGQTVVGLRADQLNRRVIQGNGIGVSGGGGGSADTLSADLSLVVRVGAGLAFDGSGNLTTTGGGPGVGTVTSVAISVPGVIYSSPVGGSPVTTSGTLALALKTQSANQVFAGPTTGAAATPTFRALVSADLPPVNLASTANGGITGTLGAGNGGTGQTTYVLGDLLYASGTGALARLADVATGNALISGGVGVAPAWGKIGLTTHVSGTLPLANGGTNATDAAGARTSLAVVNSGYVLAAGNGLTGGGTLGTTAGTVTFDVGTSAGSGITVSFDTVTIDQTAAFAPSWFGAHRFNTTTTFAGDLTMTGTNRTIGSTTGVDITLAPAGDLVTAVGGGDFYPSIGYGTNLGTLTNKWLTLHAAELWVETLVAQQTLAQIGGRILVPPNTNILTRDITSTTATTIYLKYNAVASQDSLYLEANGKIEFMRVTSGNTFPLPVSGSGDYACIVARNLDGTGGNTWSAGDAIVNTGQSGNGFIDLYSVRGMYYTTPGGVRTWSQVGPTIAMNVRNSNTYNDWSTHTALGNLNGLYDYSTNVFGFAAGKQSSHWISADATNGIRFNVGTTAYSQWKADGSIQVGRGTLSNVQITTGGDISLQTNGVEKIKLDNTGQIVVGEVAASKHNLLITAGQVKFRLNTTTTALFDTDGSLLLGQTGQPNILINTTGVMLRNSGLAVFTVDSSGNLSTAGDLTVGPATGADAHILTTGTNTLSITAGSVINITSGHTTDSITAYGNFVMSDHTGATTALAVQFNNNRFWVTLPLQQDAAATFNAAVTVASTFTVQPISGTATATFKSSASPVIVNIDRSSGTTGELRWLTLGTKRWSLFAAANPETGSNAGSDLSLVSYDDTGASLLTVMSAVRATGAVAFAGAISASNHAGSVVGNITGNGTIATGGFTLTVPATGTAVLTARTLSPGTLIAAIGDLSADRTIGLANGSAQYQVISTGASPFAPAYTALSGFAGAGLTFATGTFQIGTPGTDSVASTNSASGTTHTHAITSSSSPGAAASILATTSTGALTLGGLLTLQNPTVAGQVAGNSALVQSTRNYQTGIGLLVNMAVSTITQAWLYNGTTYTDATAEMREASGTAQTLITTTSDMVYLGAGAAFTEVYALLTANGVGGAYVWEYWNGAAWTTLTVTDGTNGFTGAGYVTWASPAGWASTAVNAVSAFYVRFRCPTTAPTTPATAQAINISLFNADAFRYTNVGIIKTRITQNADIMMAGRIFLGDGANGTAYNTYGANLSGYTGGIKSSAEFQVGTRLGVNMAPVSTVQADITAAAVGNVGLQVNGFSASTTANLANVWTSAGNGWSFDKLGRPIHTQAVAPTAVGGTGAGTGPTVTVATGSTDVEGMITVLTGTSPQINQTVVTVTFNGTWAAAPKYVQWEPANAVAAALGTAWPFCDSATGITTTTFVIKSNAVALTAATTYIWRYRVEG